jgi:hypothetical protein
MASPALSTVLIHKICSLLYVTQSLSFPPRHKKIGQRRYYHLDHLFKLHCCWPPFPNHPHSNVENTFSFVCLFLSLYYRAPRRTNTTRPTIYRDPTLIITLSRFANGEYHTGDKNNVSLSISPSGSAVNANICVK